MPALSRPDLPPGAHRGLVDALHDLHHHAGFPSLRDLGRDVGVSRTTIAAMFSDARMPRWGTLELLVEALGGDAARFHELWLAATAAPASPATMPAVASVRPHQLPAGTTHFVGRSAELAQLDRLGDDDAVTSFAVVSGAPGVGKSALVLRWAHQQRQFDGELYLDLRGHDAQRPIDPSSALEELLRGMGVDDRAIPAGRTARAALWRTTLADRRMLLVLDNVRSVDQVRDLLPGLPGSVALLTSRDSLPALVVRYGAARIELARLPRADAVALLRHLLGSRAADDPAATATLAAQCDHLPIALRLAAERAASRPRQPLAEFVAELDREVDRLDLLDLGEDGGSAVRTVFSWSLDQLGGVQRRALRLLGLFPGRELDIDAAAALFDTERTSARMLLDELARLHLVEPGGAAGFGMHDLLRTYARELLASEAADDIGPARRRLVEHYLDRAARSVEAAAPIPSGPNLSTPLGSSDPQPGWLDDQRVNLLAIATMAADHLPDAARQLSRTIGGYLDARGHYADALAVHSAALAAAVAEIDTAAEADALLQVALVRRRLGDFGTATELGSRALALYTERDDSPGRAAALVSLGIDGWRAGRYQEARVHLIEGLALHSDLGNAGAQGVALSNLGIVSRRLGDYPAAADYHRHAIEVQRRFGDKVAEGRALTNAGMVELRLGNLPTALEMHRAALALHREHNDRAAEAAALINIALVMERLGELTEALPLLDQALSISRDISYRVGEGDALRCAGVVLGRLGRVEEAVERLRSALRIGSDMGEADIETGALNELSEVLLDANRVDEAEPLLNRAGELAVRSADRYEQARALIGLGRVAAARDNQTQARQDWGRAHELLDDLGLPERTAVAAMMAGADPST